MSSRRGRPAWGSGRSRPCAPAAPPAPDGFDGSRARFDALLGVLDGESAGAMPHSELEVLLEVEGRELVRQLLQDHLDLRAAREDRVQSVADADGVARGACETGRARALASVFGDVQVSRRAYRARGHQDLCPADALLNLPAERHSHGLRRLAAIESSRGSFRTPQQGSSAPRDSCWASASWSSSPPAPLWTSTRSTPSASARPPARTTCWSCRVTARAW